MSDAERLAQALDPTVPLSQALSGCQDIAAEDAQGDCLSAALEVREGTQLQDCEQIRSDRWRDECVFVLAEQLREEDLGAAIETCHHSVYARECSYHLVRDTAREATSLPPIQAEAQIKPFEAARRAPDAPVLFWKEWARYTVRELGQSIREDTCTGLQEPQSCSQGLMKARKEMLRGVPSAERCARAEAQAPLLQLDDGTPAMSFSAMEIEEVRRSCARPKR